MRRRGARRKAKSERAQLLEQAVRERTQELWTANQALKAEAAERQAAEAQLRQVQKMEAVGQLTGGIAHDFNNMLAVVVGGLDLARRKLHGPRREVGNHLDNAMEGATRAAALTRRLLSFARAEPLLPERSTPPSWSRTCSSCSTARSASGSTSRPSSPTTPGRSGPIRTSSKTRSSTSPSTPATRWTGSGELTIRSRQRDTGAPTRSATSAPATMCVIEVTDTGCGMAPEVIERAFEPFFTTKPVGKGTGLGLSQIFGFARQSGGDVGIESAARQGHDRLDLPAAHRRRRQATSGRIRRCSRGRRTT